MIKRRKSIPSKAELEQAIASSETIAQVLRQLGINTTTYGYRRIESIAHEYGLKSKLPKNGRRIAGLTTTSKQFLSDEEFFVFGIFRAGQSIKKRLLRIGRAHECVKCKLPPIWQGEPISLQIDHIDGNKFNNRIENLRLLCPNCHSQTETFAGRGNIKYNYCACGNRISNSATYCKTCISSLKLNARPPKIEWPDEEEIQNNIEAMGYRSYSRILGVSDVAIRKHLSRLGLTPLPKRIL